MPTQRHRCRAAVLGRHRTRHVVVAVNENDAAKVVTALSALYDVLTDAREFIDDQIDVVDGSYGQPEPNKAMRLAQEIDEALALAREFRL